MKVLVTGATGFVGRAFIEEAIRRQWQVRATLRQEAGLPGSCERCITGEIGPGTDWSEALKGCDTVVHLAARVHVMQESAADPLAIFRSINTETTLNLARQAADAGIRRFVFVSTIKVNGEGRSTSYSETDAVAPQDAYAISKWEAEQGLREIAARTGMEVVILRPPLVYGVGVKANFLRLMQIVDKGWPLPFGSISNRRSLIYLGNLVNATAMCLTHPAAANKTFLVSDGEKVSTPDLILRLAAALGRPARLVAVPPTLLGLAGALVGKRQAVDRLLGSLTGDSTLIRKELDWAPPFSMEQGLNEMVDWFKQSHRHSG